MQILTAALQAGEVDASVIGAALQKCGHSRWWGTLLEVHRLQRENDIRMYGLQGRIFMTAIASCLKDRSLPKHILAERRRQGLLLSQAIWNASEPPTAEFDFNPAVDAVFNVCAAVGVEGLPWARSVYKWSQTVPQSLDIVAYTNLVSLLEHCGQHQQVDQLLSNMAGSTDAKANEVTLGNLVNEAGRLYNTARVDHLWNTLLERYGVEPNFVCYVAYAKAHLLSGRPSRAIEILDAMRSVGIGLGNQQAAVTYLQAQILVFHSDPADENLSRLVSATCTMARVELRDCGPIMKRCINELLEISGRLQSNPASLTLHRVLGGNLKMRSTMRTWPDYTAASKYLASRA